MRERFSTYHPGKEVQEANRPNCFRLERSEWQIERTLIWAARVLMNVTVPSRKEVWFRAKEDQGGDPGTPRGFQAGEKRGLLKTAREGRVAARLLASKRSEDFKRLPRHYTRFGFN